MASCSTAERTRLACQLRTEHNTREKEGHRARWRWPPSRRNWGTRRCETQNHQFRLTARIRSKHAHQWGQLRRASAMGDVQPAAGRTGDASGLRLLLLVLLLLIHGGDIFFAGGTDGEQ